MHRTLRISTATLLLVLGIAGLVFGQSPAATPPPTGIAISSGVDVTPVSSYVWRGFLLVPSLNVQPNVWLKVANLTASSWTNFARKGPNGQAFTEHDLTVDYSHTAEQVTWSVGWTNYFFADLPTGRHSNEFYAGIAWTNLLAPAITVYDDVQAGAGTYVNVSINPTFSLGDTGVTVSPSVAAGYNHHQWIDRSTWSDLNVGLKASFPFANQHLQLAPFVNYSKSLGGATFGNYLYGGVTLSITCFERH